MAALGNEGNPFHIHHIEKWIDVVHEEYDILIHFGACIIASATYTVSARTWIRGNIYFTYAAFLSNELEEIGHIIEEENQH